MHKTNFNHIASLIRENRIKAGWSQADLSGLAEMKKGQGQLISNVERGLCNLPPKHGRKICKILSIDPDKMIEAMAMDFKKSLITEFQLNGEGTSDANSN